MKVYILTVDQVYNDEIFENSYPKAYSTMEKAKKAFNAFVDEERENVQRDGWVEAEENSDTHYEAWEDGNYISNHTDARIIEATLDE